MHSIAVYLSPSYRTDGHRTVAKAVAAFLEETELTKKAEDLGRVHDRVELLHRVLPKIDLQDIERADLLKS